VQKKLAFIGLGIMGLPMAGHLLSAGHALRVHTRTRSRAEELLARGARWADSPADAARDAEAVFICVTDTPDVERVIEGTNGVLSAARQGLIVVDHSTISPKATRRLAAQFAVSGGHLLDAPISGGDVGARNATLSIMLGGDRSAFEQVEPLLRLMGKTITYCGESGAGQLTKLVNQILVGVTLAGVAEALAFAQKNNLDLARTIEAVGGGAGSSWQLLNLGPKMIANDFRPGFMIDLMLKDLRLLAEAAEESEANTPATTLVRQLLVEARDQDHGREGTQAVFRVLAANLPQ
jgi:3-hydroxyisobutyrate dehydrogenase